MTDSHVLAAPPSLRRRHHKSQLFAVLAAASLGLGVLVVAVLMVSTLRESGSLGSMHATASAGFKMSQRSAVAGEQHSPYVTIAQVDASSPAEALGLQQGDALLRLDGEAVTDVRHVWDAVAAMPSGDTKATLTWAPNAENLLGELEPVPIEGKPGVFRTRLAYVPADSPAAKAGLRDGDILVTAGGQPLYGSVQSWQTLAVAARASDQPVPIEIERGGERTTIQLPVRRQGEITLESDLLGAIWHFCTGDTDDRRYPEGVSLKVALVGSLWVLAVTMLFSFPLGIAAAVYLEEYAKRSRLTSVLQVLIANLAGVPSVVYGIIGYEILARSLGRSVLAGGITLGLLILPVMILGCREALRTVPPWVRHAAFAVGATPSQVVWHQVLPYAMPGMLTSMILAISRAIGEAAPLIMIAFLTVTHAPSSISHFFTVVPLQIFDWATKPQAGFETVTAMAIVVLLVLLLLLNGTAIVLRNRMQLRW